MNEATPPNYDDLLAYMRQRDEAADLRRDELSTHRSRAAGLAVFLMVAAIAMIIWYINNGG